MLIPSISLVLAASLLGSSAPAGDGYGKKGYEKVKPAPITKAELVATFQKVDSFEMPCMDDVAACEGKACVCMKAEELTNQVVRRIHATDGGWAMAAPVLKARFLEGDARRRTSTVGLLAASWSEEGYALAAELFEAQPDAFEEQQIVALSEAGAKRFTKECMLRVLEKDGKRADSILPAAHLALRGYDYGKPALVAALEGPKAGYRPLSERVIAALAMQRLGNGKYLADVHGKLVEKALMALDDDNLDKARELALSAEYFQSLSEKEGKALRVSWFDWGLNVHIGERSAELAEADDIFHVLEGVQTL